MSGELERALDLLDGAWRDAAFEWFTATLSADSKRSRPKGLQPFMNRIIEDRFEGDGWLAHGGRFLKGETWVRITFRHQMSLGSDFIDALKVHRKEGARQVAIFAASHEFLGTITPNDQNVLTSFEKLDGQMRDLEGCLEVPLFIGRLTPKSPLPPEVLKALRKTRPRDRYLRGDGYPSTSPGTERRESRPT